MVAQEKTLIVVSAVVSPDRRLVIDLPPDAPIGPVELIVRSTKPVHNPARDLARAKLLAANALVTNIEVPVGVFPLTIEERLRFGTLPPEARLSSDLIDEDRGEY